MNANEKKVVMGLLRCCQHVVNTREYQRIKVLLVDKDAKVGDTSSVTTLKEAFESAAIAVADLIGRGPKPKEAAAEEVRS